MKKKETDIKDYIELGLFYLLNQKYTEAIKQFKQALKMKPDAQIYFNLGLTYEAACQNSEAKDMYRKVVELDPSHKDAIEHLNHLINQ